MKLEKIDRVFPKNSIEREIAYMIATSHEYKVPNEIGAIKLVSNYKWEKKNMSIKKMQGINKPVNKEKVFNIAKTLKLKHINPFMVVDKFQGITPQSIGSKILLDGHHRKEACELKGIYEVPVYYGRYTGKSEKSIDELIEKKSNEIISEVLIEKYANEITSDIYYHASPVQGINKFRLSEDTSGNNKGKVLFASKYPSFSAAFGLRWNDGNARLNVLTKDKQVPKINNYYGSELKYTDSVNTKKPCSMYKIRGTFKPLRYPNDLEVITNSKDIKIISEEKFSDFKSMAKAYNLKLTKVTDGHIINNLKSKKSSNFEKKASEIIKFFVNNK